MAALWPERVKALVSVSGYLIGSQAAGKNPLPPEAELQWWYQYYLQPSAAAPATRRTATTSPSSYGSLHRPSGTSMRPPSSAAPWHSRTPTTWQSPCTTTAGALAWPTASAYAGKFSGRYEHRLVSGGIGHNLPQEAPEAFAKAVIDVARG
jgi:pimeloyl-ACP methyl ester carboxylesterase